MIGIVQHILPDTTAGQFTYGATHDFQRVSSYTSWITQNLFGAPSRLHSPPEPIYATGGTLALSAGTTIKQMVVDPCEESVFSLRYAFSIHDGRLSVSLGNILLGSVKGEDSQTGRFVAKAGPAEGFCAGPELGATWIPLKFEYSGPVGSFVGIEEISYPTVVNEDFQQGLTNWTTDPPSGVIIVPHTSGNLHELAIFCLLGLCAAVVWVALWRRRQAQNLQGRH